MKHSSRIGKKARISLIVLAFTIALVSSLAIAAIFQQLELNRYKRLSRQYAQVAADVIDGDRVASYLEHPVPDAYYDQIQTFMKIIQRNSDLRYYYVFVLQETGIVYIWDTDEADGLPSLGEFESYADADEQLRIVSGGTGFERDFCVTKDDSYGYIASYYLPILDSNGQLVAYVGVDLSMTDIETAVLQLIAVTVLSIAAVVGVFLVLFYFFIRKTIIVPITQLDSLARDMIHNLENQTDLQHNIHTKDEIEDLGNAFVTMFHELRNYITQLSQITAEKERISTELDIARKIQAAMLPCDFPERKEFDIYATMVPAKEVGGDFYDFFMVDSTHLAFVVADVSGKGVPAALFMAIGKTLIKDHTLQGQSLDQVFTEVNELLCEANKEGMFITAFEGVLNLDTGELVFVNAGHEVPFLRISGSQFEPKRVKAAFVLAGMEGMPYRAGSFLMKPGDQLFQYTDGVPEATDRNNQLFGSERLLDALNQAAGKRPEEILQTVKAAVDAFVGDAPQFDDLTMLALEYCGTPSNRQEPEKP